MKRLFIALACLWLAGCASLKPLTPIKVPVPVACREAEPERPVMPTDALRLEDELDVKARAMAAEIELREGYEIQVVTALRTCTKPITTEKTK